MRYFHEVAADFCLEARKIKDCVLTRLIARSR
ncbi:hypothetical protein COAQ111491_07290 [Comamonas aquatilis]